LQSGDIGHRQFGVQIVGGLAVDADSQHFQNIGEAIRPADQAACGA
jgi:hypothetical protein